jgi:hypothetical protein
LDNRRYRDCCGEAGKIRDLMTTGTDPEVGINEPMSMK